MFFQAIFRLVKLGVVNFWRNIWINLVATFVMSLTLMTITLLLVSALYVKNEIKNVESRIDYEVYLNDGTSEEKISLIKEAIQKEVAIKQIDYISKEMAVEKYKKIFGENDKLIDYIKQENPLKESLIIKTENPADLEKVNELVNSEAFKDVIRDSSYSRNRNIIYRLINIIDFIEMSGIVVGLIFIIIAVSVVFSTVRIAIYSRKDEIEIMKLVGATDWFVHAPFLIESAIYGILAALIAFAFFVGILYYVSISASSYFGTDHNIMIGYLKSYYLFIVIFQMLLGVIISVSSAFVAIRRHL